MQALIVTDQSEFCQSLEAFARQEGFELVVVASIDSAVEAFKARQHPLVIARCRSSQDAVLFCRSLSEHDPQHRSLIMLVIDCLPTAELERIFATGADDFLFTSLDPTLRRMRLNVAASRVRDRARAATIEQQLRESVERFDLAVTGANDGLWDSLLLGKPWHHPDTKVWFSPRLKELMGFRDDEFPNLLGAWEARLHPDDRDPTIQSIVQHVEHRVPYDVEYRLLTKSGEYRWFNARGQAQWDEQGRLMRISGSLRDIQQTKEYEAKLHQSEAQWRSLVENAPDIIVLASPDGTMQFINRTAPLSQQAIGRTVYEFIAPEDHPTVRQAFAAVCATGQPQRYEIRSVGEEGGIAWYSSRLGPIWQDGRVESVVLIATDISPRKNAERQLERGRQLMQRLLDLQERERQLVAYEIHDGLVQSLAAALMHLEATAVSARMTSEAKQDYQRGLTLLREAVAEGRRLISGLRPPILDERGVVAAIEYLVSEAQQYIPEIELVTHAHFGRLVAPLEVAIFRITQEALANIRQHSGATRARVEFLQHGQWVRLLIRDWGCGFDPAHVPVERFGLQGIRERARLLGTRATIESQPGHGAVIAVDFPLITGDEPPEKPEP